jgi:hypothetical protein
MRLAPAAPAGKVHSEIAIVAHPALQTQPSIAILFLLVFIDVRTSCGKD